MKDEVNILEDKTFYIISDGEMGKNTNVILANFCIPN